ncbi:MAG TPA: hypothetical protein EYQ50_23360 [Verrucomicrobiales bacterium]|nr:hypothetical protein [Verrucomicrobiales bacterium]
MKIPTTKAKKRSSKVQRQNKPAPDPQFPTKKHVGNVKGSKWNPEPLTKDEVLSLIKACSTKGVSGIRNKALIVVLWRAGLRISEALALKPSDYDPEKGTLRVLMGKGGKMRLVGLDPRAGAVLDHWIEKRANLGAHGRHRIFCQITQGALGKPVESSYVRHLMKRLAVKAGLEKRVHAHGLRHTMASEMRAENIDIGIISKQLGHSSISTTARYIDHLNPAETIKAARDRVW